VFDVGIEKMVMDKNMLTHGNMPFISGYTFGVMAVKVTVTTRKITGISPQ
jgi:hypothetical protein